MILQHLVSELLLVKDNSRIHQVCVLLSDFRWREEIDFEEQGHVFIVEIIIFLKYRVW